jgi:1-acyl-sn-glycerol-3-phosphate acyltransferase
MAFFPKQITFFAKKELKYVPILGFNLIQMGHVLVDRGKGKKALTQLNMIKSKLLDGKSIIIFPEGTRSSDGQIASFKKGAFVLSNQTSKPLIPCLISGTGKTLPKNKFWITNTKIKLHILPEVRVMVKEKDNKTLVDLYKTTTRDMLLETQKKLDLI